MRTAIIILTYNASATIGLLLDSIQSQTLKPDQVIVIDSSSIDSTTQILQARNITYYTIKKIDFDHGTTRKYAVSLVDADIYIFLTQDVKLANKDAFRNIVNAFTDEKVGCAYGRQLPNEDATVLAAHMRLFTYPETSSVRSYEDRKIMGIKTCMNSDNFAAYRKTALLDIGSFPENAIIAEDMYVAAKMLMQGWKVAYEAHAMIYHSHNYTIKQEFQRYFDIGVFHAMNSWICKNFNTHIRDGFKYLQSAIVYCVNKQAYFTLPEAVISPLARYLGFHVGKQYKLIPNFIRKKMSMYSNFWNSKT